MLRCLWACDPLLAPFFFVPQAAAAVASLVAGARAIWESYSAAMAAGGVDAAALAKVHVAPLLPPPLMTAPFFRSLMT